MKTLYLDRSVSTGRSGAWVNELELTDVTRIVVGMGPGSFAGIRSALAFAQGYALGRKCEVFGLPSPCALARAKEKIAVIGDARRGKLWIAIFDGFKLEREIFQVPVSELAHAVDASYRVVSPDDARIGALLRETFSSRYEGEALPTSEGLRAFAEANPAVLTEDPLPIYLNPAVRNDN